jgi:4-amino-4-deoxy-L-arabinose transferase-like glycosyltransferase
VAGALRTQTGAGGESREHGAEQLSRVVLALLVAVVLFYDLGGPALVEPDEGRNGEVAREILLLGDWLTPHYNFVPRLDKPLFYYLPIALSYRLFGVSEWSARFPSALAGAGVVVLTWRLARTLFGEAQALWSVLVLVTSVGFAASCRIAASDMLLSFFIALSLCAFLRAEAKEAPESRVEAYLGMYLAMGAGVLVKGAVGVVLPAMIVASYLLVTRRLSELRRLRLVSGLCWVALLAGPWYVMAELRNPGYLAYFFGEEHLLRFFTSRYHRSEPWYYYLVIVALGILPWTIFLPRVVKSFRAGTLERCSAFLVLWAVLPVVLFTLSRAKLPQYILPAYPALSLLLGGALCGIAREPSAKGWALPLRSLPVCLSLVVLALGLWGSRLFAGELRVLKHQALFGPEVLLAAGATLALGLLSVRGGKPAFVYPACCAAFVALFLAAETIVRQVALARSSKELAAKASAFFRPGDRWVIYDTYLSSLPFYLRIEQPMWVVWSGKKNAVMGSFYVAQKQPLPAPGYGRALLTFEDFAPVWESCRSRLLVFVKVKNLPGLSKPGVVYPRELVRAGDVVVVTNVCDAVGGGGPPMPLRVRPAASPAESIDG